MSKECHQCPHLANCSFWSPLGINVNACFPLTSYIMLNKLIVHFEAAYEGVIKMVPTFRIEYKALSTVAHVY